MNHFKTGLFTWMITAGLVLGAKTAIAAPTLAGVNDRGVYNGEHYYEVYFTLDTGSVCSVGNNPWELVAIPYSPQAPFMSYTGQSGYSPNVCQINLHAPAGTGILRQAFLWQDAPGVLSGILSPITLDF